MIERNCTTGPTDEKELYFGSVYLIFNKLYKRVRARQSVSRKFLKKFSGGKSYFELSLSFSLALPSKLPRPPAIFLPTSSVLFRICPPTLLAFFPNSDAD